MSVADFLKQNVMDGGPGFMTLHYLLVGTCCNFYRSCHKEHSLYKLRLQET